MCGTSAIINCWLSFSVWLLPKKILPRIGMFTNPGIPLTALESWA